MAAEGGQKKSSLRRGILRAHKTYLMLGEARGSDLHAQPAESAGTPLWKNLNKTFQMTLISVFKKLFLRFLKNL